MKHPNSAQMIAWEIWWRLKRVAWFGLGVVLFPFLWAWDKIGRYRRRRVVEAISGFFFGDRSHLDGWDD